MNAKLSLKIEDIDMLGLPSNANTVTTAALEYALEACKAANNCIAKNRNE